MKDCIADGLLNIFHIKTNINCADLLSKPIRVVEQFEFLRSMIMECADADVSLLESSQFRKRKRQKGPVDEVARAVMVSDRSSGRKKRKRRRKNRTDQR